MHFVVSLLPSLFKSPYHCVPLSSEVSQMSGSHLCFLCLFDGFRFRNGLSLKQASQQGELVVRGRSPSSTRSAFQFSARSLKKNPMRNRKDSFVRSGERTQGAVSELGLSLMHCSQEICREGFVGSSNNHFCLAQQIRGRLLSAA